MTCKLTQKARVLALLKRGWTTTIQCIYTLGCTTLSQRAGELRREGYKVVSRRVAGKNYHEYRVLK